MALAYVSVEAGDRYGLCWESFIRCVEEGIECLLRRLFEYRVFHTVRRGQYRFACENWSLNLCKVAGLTMMRLRVERPPSIPFEQARYTQRTPFPAAMCTRASLGRFTSLSRGLYFDSATKMYLRLGILGAWETVL